MQTDRKNNNTKKNKRIVYDDFAGMLPELMNFSTAFLMYVNGKVIHFTRNKSSSLLRNQSLLTFAM